MSFGIVCIVFCKQMTAYELRISDWSSDVCSSDLRLYVSDDDANKVYVVDQANPTVKLAEFSTDTFGSTRTSDITMAPDGNLFILDQAKIGRASCRERVCQYV